MRTVNVKLYTFLNIIPVQKLWKRCKKKKKMPMQLWMKKLVMLIMKWMMKYLTQYFCKEIERNNFNDSAETWGFSPIKPVGKRDILYGQEKVKLMKTGLIEKSAETVRIKIV